MSKHSEAFVAFDSSKLRNAVAIADGGREGEVRFLGEIDSNMAAITQLVHKLEANYERITFCYEAGPTGYELQRHIKALGHECLVVAPSLIPKKPGDRVKTNRRDAVSLVKLLRAGELTAVWVPDRRHEAMRDLTRARETAVIDLRAKRQQVSAFLLRQGRWYPAGKKSWTKVHMDKEAILGRFAEYFAEVVDPRRRDGDHDLTEMLFIALLAALCGAKYCTDIEVFGRAKEDLLRTVLALKNGIPSHDTFSRIFRMLDPKSLEKAFRRFTAAFAESVKIDGVIALDGKALRRAYERGKSHMPPIMVTAWAAKTRLALANILSPGNNEAAGALELIEMLQLKGCVVTMDALHCRRDTAQAIVERGGDYVLAVKDNQPGLLRDAKAAIAKAEHNGAKQATTTDADHDRKETRTAMVAPAKDLAEKHDFPGLAGVARVKSKRGRDKQIERYFLLTRCYKPAELLGIVRQHWGIENTLHWTLDVVLDEDLARSRKDNAPANLAVLRRLALNIARAHPNSKASMRAKLKRAGWDEKFLLEMLTNMR